MFMAIETQKLDNMAKRGVDGFKFRKQIRICLLGFWDRGDFR